MRYIFLILNLICWSRFANATVFPDGYYSGKGIATNAQGVRFTYDVELTISKLKWKYIYNYPGNKTVVYEMDDVSQGNGFYKMISKGIEVGSGYCGAAQCRLKLNLPVGNGTQKIDITSHFLNDVMYTLGENATTGFYFEESLKLSLQ